jgi:hypothetical protein
MIDEGSAGKALAQNIIINTEDMKWRQRYGHPIANRFKNKEVPSGTIMKHIQ